VNIQGNSTLNVGFAGTPEFAKVALECLIASGYHVCLVLTQPDRPAGRGMKMTPSPVKQSAIAHHIPIYQPVSLKKGDDAAQVLTAIRTAVSGQPLDLLIVAAYGLILPQAVLDAPRLGCLNIHASLLPRWRGAAPIQRAIEAGDSETGICIMQMEAGLDTGPVRLSRNLQIESHATAATLHDQLAILGGGLLVEALDALVVSKLTLTPQPNAGVTYAEKISKVEGSIDWTKSAVQLQRALRAFDPFPGAFTQFGEQVLKCFNPTVVPQTLKVGEPGEVLAIKKEGVWVQCGQGVLCVTSLQKAGSKRTPASQLAQALNIEVGSVFMIVNKENKHVQLD
jgi:methionyl-tRNA formyltransferase